MASIDGIMNAQQDIILDKTVAENGTSINEYWKYLFYDLADPRTNDWFLLASPIPGLTVLGLWMYFVLSWGPKWMANRKPFNLNKVLVVYNVIQVLVSVYIVVEAIYLMILTDYTIFKCNPVDWTVNPLTLRICKGFYVYFLAKMTELLDTIFFVLRKKNKQISFLHMYHHTCMPMIAWGCTKYYPGGHASFIGLINSFVHIIMYTYYLLAAMGPALQKYLWWKKYLTTLQLAQFCIAFLHFTQLIFQPYCGYPRWSAFIVLPNAVLFYYLFSDFYKKAYCTTEKKDE